MLAKPLIRSRVKSKLGIFLTISIGLFGIQTNALAAVTSKNQAAAKVKAIQKAILKDSADLITTNNNLTDETNSQQNKNQLAMDNFENSYKAQKAASDAKTATALAKINELSYFVVQVNNLSRCNGLCAVGAVINLPFLPNDDFTQQGIDQNVKAGAMTPQNKSAYDSARNDYSKALQDALMQYSQYLTDKKKLEGAGNLILLTIATKYETLKNNITNQIALEKKVLLAAKRALVSGLPYESNFKTAYIFQYNVDTSYAVANSPFETINSFMSAKAVVSASDDYSLGYAISQHYNLKQALAFNKQLQGAYTEDPDFKKELSSAIKIYQSI